VIVAVSGAGGLIGSALVGSLKADGHRAIPLVRRAPRPGEDALGWDPLSGALTPARSAISSIAAAW